MCYGLLSFSLQDAQNDKTDLLCPEECHDSLDSHSIVCDVGGCQVEMHCCISALVLRVLDELQPHGLALAGPLLLLLPSTFICPYESFRLLLSQRPPLQL